MASRTPPEPRRSGARVALVLGLAALTVVALLVVRITRQERRVEERVTSSSSAMQPTMETSAPSFKQSEGPDAVARAGQQDASSPRPDRSTGPHPTTPKKTVRRAAPRSKLSPEVAALLKEARTELQKKEFRSTLRLANRTLMMQKDQQEAYILMAKAHCGLRDIGMVRAMLRRVPRSYHGRVWKFCSGFGVQGP